MPRAIYYVARYDGGGETASLFLTDQEVRCIRQLLADAGAVPGVRHDLRRLLDLPLPIPGWRPPEVRP